MMRKKSLVGIILLSLILFNSCSIKENVEKLDVAGFKNPPSTAKLHTWWHWMDGAITKEGISRDLEAMQQQGIVQATLFNIGLFNERDFGVPKIRFNSPEWYQMFHWAVQEANRLGITLGAHNCDGWSTSGGPWITSEMSMKQYVWTKTLVEGAQTISINLPRPYVEQDFYNDVAVVAVLSTATTNSSFQKAKPKITVNDSIETAWLTDGNPVSALAVKRGDRLLCAFQQPFRAEKITVHPRRRFQWGSTDSFNSHFVLRASDDGVNFRMIKEFEIKGLNHSAAVTIPSTTARFFELELKDFSNINSWIPFTIAELELLKQPEPPLYAPTVAHHLAKTASVKADNPEHFFNEEIRAGLDSSVSRFQTIDLTDKMSEDGTLQWEAPAGNWVILRFGYTTTGVVNAPATPAGRGLECDKMDRAAVDLHFNNYPQKLIDQAGPLAGNTFKFLLIDSWECEFQNWSTDFVHEFKQRRGYGIIEWIPVLCGESVGNTELSEAFLYDFRRTIAELIEENYYQYFSERCQQANLEMHAEVIYGGGTYPPLDIIRANRHVDLPMHEFWTGLHPKTSFVTYTPTMKPDIPFPIFAANCYQKPVVGAEAYTAQAHYSESPWDLKPFGDRAYCSGINQFILHSYVHQPFEKKPGMTLGPFASHFNRHNLYWPHLSDWSNYHARVQYLLQKGVVAAQVLVFVGDQLPQFLPQNKAFDLPTGYRFNVCNFDVLKNKIQIENGKLQMKNGTSYSVLCLPEAPVMELETLQRIAELVNQGAVVYGPKPRGCLSLKNRRETNRALQTLADQLWGKIDGKQVTEQLYGKGKVVWGKPLEMVLKNMKVLPAFETNHSDSPELLFIHKKLGDSDLFFVANQLNQELQRECLFAIAEKAPEIWDPESGTITTPAIYRQENGRIRLPVHFNPRQSRFFVFQKKESRPYITTVQLEENQIFPVQNKSDESYSVPEAIYNGNRIDLTATQTGVYTFTTNQNKNLTLTLESPAVFELTDFQGTIDFLPAYPAEIASVLINQLKSWTEFEDPAIKYFSGSASYQIDFNLPADFCSPTDSLLICFGEISSTAEVFLNDHALGDLWQPASVLNGSGLLKPENRLEMKVANVFRNRFIGDYQAFGKIKNIWTSAPIEMYLDQDKPLKPSGLMGPIKIMKIRKQPLVLDSKN